MLDNTIQGTALPKPSGTLATPTRSTNIQSYPFVDPVFKEATTKLKEGRTLITDGQVKNGIKSIKEGIVLLKEITEKDYKKLIKIFPFSREKFDESLELALATQDSAHKLIKKFEQILKDLQEGKTESVQTPSPSAKVENIPFVKARIFIEVLGIEGLQDDLCVEDREKAFRFLGVTTEAEKLHIVQLALELPTIQARYEEEVQPTDGLLLKKYGINDPNAKYNNKIISEVIEELKQKLLQGEEPIVDTAGSTFEARREFTQTQRGAILHTVDLSLATSAPDETPLTTPAEIPPPQAEQVSFTPAESSFTQTNQAMSATIEPPLNPTTISIPPLLSPPLPQPPLEIEPTEGTLLNLPSPEQIDEIVKQFINNLKETEIISEQQGTALTLIAHNPGLANLAANRDFQALESKLSDYSYFKGHNLSNIIRGFRFDERKDTNRAYCLELCNFLRQLSTTTPNTEIRIWEESRLQEKRLTNPKPDLPPRKISDGEVNPYKELIDIHVQNYNKLVDKALRNQHINEKEYNFLHALINNLEQVKISNLIPEQINPIIKKLEFYYVDLFSKVNFVANTKNLINYGLERTIPAPTSQIENLANALGIKPLLLQAYLYQLEGLEPKPEIKSAFDKGLTPTSEGKTILIGTTDKEINDFIKIFFELYVSHNSNWGKDWENDFKLELSSELHKEYNRQFTSEEVATRLSEGCGITSEQFTVLSKYYELRSSGEKVTLEALLNKLSSNVDKHKLITRIVYLKDLYKLKFDMPLFLPRFSANGSINEFVSDLVFPKNEQSLEYKIAKSYVDYINTPGKILPTKNEILQGDVKDFQDALNNLNNILRSSGYSELPLLESTFARNIYSICTANEKLNLDTLHEKRQRQTKQSKEELAKSLLQNKHSEDFKKLKQLNPGFENILNLIQAEATDYLLELELGTEISAKPLTHTLTEEEISILLPDAKQQIGNFLSSESETQRSLAPNPDAYYESIRKIVDYEDRYLEKLGLTKEHFTVAWYHWQLYKHNGAKHLVDFKTLLDKTKQERGLEELSGEKLLSILDELNALCKNNFYTNIDSSIVHEFIDKANYPTKDGSYETFQITLERNGTLGKYKLGSQVNNRLQKLRFGTDEWKIIRAYSNLGGFNGKADHITITDFEDQLRNKKYAFTNFNLLYGDKGIIEYLNRVFKRLEISAQISFYEPPKAESN